MAELTVNLRSGSRGIVAKVIGIVGSRRRISFEDYIAVKNALFSVYEQGDTLVSGGCPQGADHFAEVLSRFHEIPIKLHYAEWKKYGKSAGFKRNTYIAADADVLIACVAADRLGGTEDTIRKYTSMLKTQLILV